MDMTELFTYQIIIFFIIVVRKKKKERKRREKARIIHLAREHHRISSQRRTPLKQRAVLGPDPSSDFWFGRDPVVLVS